MSFENKHFMCRSCINMVKVHPLLLLPASLFTEDVYSGTHFWKSPLCDVREGTDNSSRGWLCPQRVPCFSSPSKLVEASSKGSLPLWQTANRGLNMQFSGEVQTFFLDIWFKKSRPLEFRVKKENNKRDPLMRAADPGGHWPTFCPFLRFWLHSTLVSSVRAKASGPVSTGLTTSHLFMWHFCTQGPDFLSSPPTVCRRFWWIGPVYEASATVVINQTRVTVICRRPPGPCLFHAIGQRGAGWLGGVVHI